MSLTSSKVVAVWRDWRKGIHPAHLLDVELDLASIHRLHLPLHDGLLNGKVVINRLSEESCAHLDGTLAARGVSPVDRVMER